jgi:hypothetical protein
MVVCDVTITFGGSVVGTGTECGMITAGIVGGMVVMTGTDVGTQAGVVIQVGTYTGTVTLVCVQCSGTVTMIVLCDVVLIVGGMLVGVVMDGGITTIGRVEGITVITISEV